MSDVYERQLFDMNCNDCIFMQRSLSKRQQHVDLHYSMQKNLFDTERLKVLKAGERRLAKGETEKAKALFKEARQMQFVFTESSCSLFYGFCTAKKKYVSFILETIMEENFNCFQHRKTN